MAEQPKVSHRPAIYANKSVRVQGMISKAGATCFEIGRRALAKVSGWKASKISDADTIEFLAREFVKRLKGKKR